MLQRRAEQRGIRLQVCVGFRLWAWVFWVLGSGFKDGVECYLCGGGVLSDTHLSSGLISPALRQVDLTESVHKVVLKSILAPIRQLLLYFSNDKDESADLFGD